VSLSSIDPQFILEKLSTEYFLGFLIQGVILFVIGGVVAFFMKSENDHWKLFVIGMTAPAMLTGINNAHLYNDLVKNQPDVSSENSNPTLGQVNSSLTLGQKNSILTLNTKIQVAQIGEVDDFIRTLLAAKHKSNALPGHTIEVLHAIPRKGRFDKFLRGLLGIKITPPNWFVIDRKFEANDRKSALIRQGDLKEIFADRSIDIAIVRNPYAGSEDKFYVLLGGEEDTSRPKTKYILDRLKPVLFSSAVQAETVALEAMRLIDENSMESGGNRNPTNVRVTYPDNTSTTTEIFPRSGFSKSEIEAKASLRLEAGALKYFIEETNDKWILRAAWKVSNLRN